MKKTSIFSKRLGDSNGTVKDCPNNEMQAAAQPPENGKAEKKSPAEPPRPACRRRNRADDNPDYDPEAEPGEPNSERYKIENGGGSRNEYGDEFKDAMDMIKEYSTSEYGRVTDSWGDKHVQLTKKGTWVDYGKSEKIKCEHELVDTVESTDGRLAKGQEYSYGLLFQRVWLTYDPDEGDFVVKKTEKLKNLNSAFHGWKFSATCESRRKINFLREKNMEIVVGPTALGQSRIYWIQSGRRSV